MIKKSPKTIINDVHKTCALNSKSQTENVFQYLKKVLLGILMREKATYDS